MTKITKNQFHEVQAMSSVSNSLNHILCDINSFISLLQRVNDVHSLRTFENELGNLFINFVDKYDSSLTDDNEKDS